MIAALLSLVLGLPTLSQGQLTVHKWQTMCGYIAHPSDEHDTWVTTTDDHCRVLQQEAIETWWDDTILEMQVRGEI